MILSNTATEKTFAEENSINIAPVVHAEWNYNSIHRPYVVTSVPYGEVDSWQLNSYAGWTKVSGSGISEPADFNDFALDDISPTQQIGFKLIDFEGTQSDSVRFNFDPEGFFDVSSGFPAIKLLRVGDFVTFQNVTSTNDNVNINADVGEADFWAWRIEYINEDENYFIASGAGFRDIGPFSGSGGQGIISFNSKIKRNAIRLRCEKRSVATTYRSNYIAKSDSNYYKMVFFVKSEAPVLGYNYAPISASSITASISPSGTEDVDLYYRIVPIGPNGEQSAGDLDGNDIVNIKASSTGIADQSVTLSWNSDTNSIFNIFRARGNSENLRYLGTTRVSKNNAGLYEYIDSSLPATDNADNLLSINALPVQNYYARLMPSILLTENGTPVTSGRQIIKVYESPTSTPKFGNNSIDVTSITYQKVEIMFGSDDDFNNIEIDLTISADYDDSSILLYSPEIYQISKWDLYNDRYYPPESAFYGNRPGETLLNSLLPDSDKRITDKEISKPVSFAVFNPDSVNFGIAPYKQLSNQNIKINNLFKYYISDSGKPSIYAKYTQSISINKIVIKVTNKFTDISKESGEIYITSAGSKNTFTFNIGDFNSSGVGVFYFDGSLWSSQKPDGFPYQIDSNGYLINVLNDVSAIGMTVTSLSDSTSRMHLIELSPRLEIDLSNAVEDFSVNKSMDDGESITGFPLSYINANTCDLTINNFPIDRNGFAHTIFDDFAEKATFYHLLKQNVKFTGYLYSPMGSFNDNIPMFCMYSDSWKISGISNVQVSLYDATKANLMRIQAPDYLSENENMFNTITNILDSVGFSDYDWDGLHKIMKRRAKNTTHFWCDRTITVFDALKSFFSSHQIGAYFDEYGMMRFTDIDDIIVKSMAGTENVDFVVTDIPVAKPSNSNGPEITYISNLEQEGFDYTVANKIGKVSVEYSVPVRAVTDQLNIAGMANKEQQEQALWYSVGNAGLISSRTKTWVPYSDNYLSTDKNLTTMIDPTKPPKYTIGDFSGMAFLNGELISWNSLEYTFTPYSTSTYITITGNVIFDSKLKATSKIWVDALPGNASAKNIKTGMSVNAVPIDGVTIPTTTVVTTPPVTLINTPAQLSTSVVCDIVDGRLVASNPEQRAAVDKLKASMKVTTSTASIVFADTHIKYMVASGTYYNGKSASTVIYLDQEPEAASGTYTFNFSLPAHYEINISKIPTASVSTDYSPSANFALSDPVTITFEVDNANQVTTPLLKNSLNINVRSGADLNQIISEIIGNDVRIKGLKYDFTGRVLGVSRGEKLTSVRTHRFFDESSKAVGGDVDTHGYSNPNNFFRKDFIVSKYFIGNKALNLGARSSLTSPSVSMMSSEKNGFTVEMWIRNKQAPSLGGAYLLFGSYGTVIPNG